MTTKLNKKLFINHTLGILFIINHTLGAIRYYFHQSLDTYWKLNFVISECQLFCTLQYISYELWVNNDQITSYLGQTNNFEPYLIQLQFDLNFTGHLNPKLA